MTSPQQPDAHRAFFAARGDQRQVWARTTEQPPRDFYLPEGGVTPEVRAQARADELLCPIADCPAPEFIARGGVERRHHFAHHAGTKHDPVLVQLHAAAAALRAWVDERHPAMHATPDPAAGRLEVVSPKTLKRLTLTVAYRRDELPAADRPGQQTLLGHLARLLPGVEELEDHPGLYGCGRIRLIDRVLGSRGHLLLLNPEAKLVGTLLSRQVARELKPDLSAGLADYVIFVEPLARCELGEQGLRSPTSKRADELPAPAPPPPPRRPTPRPQLATPPVQPPAPPTPATVPPASARREPADPAGLVSVRHRLGPRLVELLSELVRGEEPELPTTCDLSSIHWRLLIAEQIRKGTPPTVTGVREQIGGRGWAPSLPDEELARYLQHLRNTGLLGELLTGRVPG